jgi:glycosyltransferase involved in cell wall biosynthesis
MKTLLVAHGHPDVRPGGAEVAALALLEGLRAQGHETLLLARTHEEAHGGSAFSARGEHELLFHVGMLDFFNFRAREPERVWKDYRELLERFRPEVVHFHHYSHMGLELLHETRLTLPECRIVLTLHEFLALCHHNGQMVKRPSLELCYRSLPADCARCFPEHGASDLFMRERFIKAAFGVVDAFIAPSAFLAERYKAWGVPAERMHVLENAPRPVAKNGAAGPAREHPTRFAFFGQANPFKGLDLALEAFALLPKSVRKKVSFDVHAASLDEQKPEFRAKVQGLLEGLNGAVRFHGPYLNSQLGALMTATDWVLVPSIWWENSPVVIQEAFAHRRPVICADIGGMQEKVRDGIDGLHFRARSPHALASVLERAAFDADLHRGLQEGIEPRKTLEEAVREHLGVYLAEPARA